MERVSFARLLDHLAGREDPAVQKRMDDATVPAETVQAALRLLEAGRRAVAASVPSARLRKRATRVFREARAPEARPGGLLRLVIDNVLRPAPALRTGAAAAARFLRFEGERTVELQATPRERGLELRGQVTPAHGIDTATLRAGGRTRTAPVDESGLFVFRRVRAGRIELDFGVARIVADLE
jgi:hypothetical protein